MDLVRKTDMAAKKQAPKAPAPAETADVAAAPNNRKMIIIFAAVLILAIGASVGGTIFLLNPGDGANAEPEKPVYTKALYLTFSPAFVVNYLVANKPRFLQSELALMARDPEVLAAVNKHAPLVRAKLLDTLSSQDFSELQTQAGKEALQKSLRKTVNTILKEQGVDGKAEAILFSTFVLQ
jgi:flagellar protein FliL